MTREGPCKRGRMVRRGQQQRRKLFLRLMRQSKSFNSGDRFLGSVPGRSRNELADIGPPKFGRVLNSSKHIGRNLNLNVNGTGSLFPQRHYLEIREPLKAKGPRA